MSKSDLKEILRLIEELQFKVESNELEIEELKIENKRRDKRIEELESLANRRLENVDEIAITFVEFGNATQENLEIINENWKENIGYLETLERKIESVDKRYNGTARKLLNIEEKFDVMTYDQNVEIHEVKDNIKGNNKMVEFFKKDLDLLFGQTNKIVKEIRKMEIEKKQ